MHKPVRCCDQNILEKRKQAVIGYRAVFAWQCKTHSTDRTMLWLYHAIYKNILNSVLSLCCAISMLCAVTFYTQWKSALWYRALNVTKAWFEYSVYESKDAHQSVLMLLVQNYLMKLWFWLRGVSWMHSPWTGDKTPGKSVSKKEMKNFNDKIP